MRHLTWWFDSIEEMTGWLTNREVYIVEVRQYEQAGSGAITYDVSFAVDFDRHAEILGLYDAAGNPFPVDEDDWDD